MALRELSIEQVQRWVVSFLVLAVASFPLGALTAVVHAVVGEGRRSDGILLLVVMAVLGMVALTVLRLLHRRSPWSPWIVCGTLPAVAAALFLL